MTEQQDAPLLSTEPDVEGHKQLGLPEDQDTEGHLRLYGTVNSEDEDVEGHRAAPLEGEDTEGHLFAAGLPGGEDEDTEGHLKALDGLTSEDEDVEGHMRNAGSAVQPGFDEDGSAEH